jgi:hypothetical protein
MQEHPIRFEVVLYGHEQLLLALITRSNRLYLRPTIWQPCSTLLDAPVNAQSATVRDEISSEKTGGGADDSSAQSAYPPILSVNADISLLKFRRRRSSLSNVRQAAIGLPGIWHQYAIHGTNKPDPIGGFVSYGCIRMHNRDVLDLYQRVQVGTPVVVLR